MRVGSLFSGIGGIDLGLERAGMEVVWQCEIDPFRRRVLTRHWPDVERFEDVRRFRSTPAGQNISAQRGDGLDSRAIGNAQGSLGSESVDLICGGFPCQDLSVAGRRAGLHAARSGLFFEFARIVGEVLPAWILVENVPGLLSSNGGDDFRVVLDSLQGLGYGLSWRILDSRHFGVPQRRRRVYVVGSLGDLRSAAVLFESEGGGGDTPQGQEAGEGAAYALAGRFGGGGEGGRYGNAWNTTYVSSLQGASTGRRGHRNDVEGAAGGQLIVPTLRSAKNRTGGDRPPGTDVDTAESLICAPADPDGVREATGVPRRMDAREKLSLALSAKRGYRLGDTRDETLVAIQESHPGEVSTDDAVWALGGDRGQGRGTSGVLAQPEGQDGVQGLQGDAARLCCPDGPRYAALGDAVTVNVAEWIGRRIMMAEEAS